MFRRRWTVHRARFPYRHFLVLVVQVSIDVINSQLGHSLTWPIHSWICRNVAMMTYASLVTRSFSSRRTNLDRDHESLVKRLTASDFFGRYPSLHGVLKSELEFSSREHLNDLPVSHLSPRRHHLATPRSSHIYFETDFRPPQQPFLRPHAPFAAAVAEPGGPRRGSADGCLRPHRQGLRYKSGVEGALDDHFSSRLFTELLSFCCRFETLPETPSPA